MPSDLTQRRLPWLFALVLASCAAPAAQTRPTPPPAAAADAPPQARDQTQDPPAPQAAAPATSAAPAAPGAKVEAVRRNFLDACTRTSQGQAAICRCVLAAAEGRWGAEGFARVAEDYERNKADPEVKRFLAAESVRCTLQDPGAFAKAEAAYKEACVKGGARASVCDCSFAALEAKYGREGLMRRFRDVGEHKGAPEFEAEVRERSATCLAQDEGYQREAFDGYVRSCVAEGLAEAPCRCMLDDLIARFTREGLVRVFYRVGNGEKVPELEPAIQDAVGRCVSKP